MGAYRAPVGLLLVATMLLCRRLEIRPGPGQEGVIVAEKVLQSSSTVVLVHVRLNTPGAVSWQISLGVPVFCLTHGCNGHVIGHAQR